MEEFRTLYNGVNDCWEAHARDLVEQQPGILKD